MNPLGEPLGEFQLITTKLQVYEMPLQITEENAPSLNVDLSHSDLQPLAFLILDAETLRPVVYVILSTPTNIDWEEVGGEPYYAVTFLGVGAAPDELIKSAVVLHLQEDLGFDLGVPVEKISSIYEWHENLRKAETARSSLGNDFAEKSITRESSPNSLSSRAGQLPPKE
tara:strand:- start:47 stop:556 length:510 start_codon:yes stop_codon:yes gene_type:complete